MEQFCNPRCMLCTYQSNKSPFKKIVINSTLLELIRFVKCMNNQQIYLNFVMYFYLYVLQHVSTCIPAIFRVMIQ